MKSILSVTAGSVCRTCKKYGICGDGMRMSDSSIVLAVLQKKIAILHDDGHAVSIRYSGCGETFTVISFG
jgi:hypothetical protein